MKTHLVKFFQFLEANEGKYVPLKYKLLNSDKLKITKDELNVDGDLNLSHTNITALPRGLMISGYLDLFNCTSLKALPDGLQVVWSLYLNGCTSLRSLPNGLKVGGDLNLEDTPLAKMYNADEIRAIIEANGGGYVTGNIYI